MKLSLLKKVEYFLKKVKGSSTQELVDNNLNARSFGRPVTRIPSFAIGKPLTLTNRIQTETSDRRLAADIHKQNGKEHPALIDQKEIIELILETQEQERRRIAEGLHNGLGQLLYAIKLKFESLGINKEPWDNTKIPSQIEALINEAIEQTRNISFELMPAILKDFGLEITLYELCKRLDQGPTKFFYSFSLSFKMESSLETAIFRIVQELVNNVIRHSKATEAHIILEEFNNAISVRVKDNGCGFDSTRQAKGIGLSSIRNRVSLLDGQLEINSLSAKGTEVIIKIPRT